MGTPGSDNLSTTSSNFDTVNSDPVISSDDNTRVPITSLIYNPSSNIYCCGKEDGTVVVYTISKGKKIRQIAKHALSASVIKLVWSSSGKYFASGDDSGRIMVKKLEQPSGGKDEFAVFKVIDRRIDEAIEQLLFHAQDGYLLIVGRTTAYVMNLKTRVQLSSIHCPEQGHGLWINHPSSPTLLVRVNAGQTRQYSWKDPLSKDEPILSSLQDINITDTQAIVQRVVLVRDRWLVLEILSTDPDNASTQIRNIELLDLHKRNESNTSKRQIVMHFADHVRCLIGCFQDQVVFVDHQFWICTWALEPVYTKHKRRFFLPKDWLSPTALRLLVLDAQGTLMCPRNGEVAIVRSGLKCYSKGSLCFREGRFRSLNYRDSCDYGLGTTIVVGRDFNQTRC